MSVDVSEATVIERPIGEVSGYAGDPSHAPAWCRRITSAEWETDPPIALGSRITYRARLLWRELAAGYHVVDYTPGSQVAVRTTDGPLPMRTTCTWRPLSDRATHMVLRLEVEPRGAVKLVTPFVAPVMRRAMRRDLARLKRLLERGG